MTLPSIQKLSRLITVGFIMVLTSFYAIANDIGSSQNLGPDYLVDSTSFGASVSVKGNMAAVGAPNEEGGGGAVYIYFLEGNHWVQRSRLSVVRQGVAPLFGLAVAIDGNNLIVGAPGESGAGGENSGTAYIFSYNGIEWSQDAKLQGDGFAQGNFGRSVSLEGTTAVVGAIRDDGVAPFSGTAYVFEKNGFNWIKQAKLYADDGASRDKFGASLSLSGNRILISAHEASADNGEERTGAAYMFLKDGNIWRQETKLVSSDQFAENRFGHSVALYRNRAVVGATGVMHNGVAAGAAYGFSLVDNQWLENETITPIDRSSYYHFGQKMAIDGNTLLVTADLAQPDLTRGVAWVFSYDGSGWVEQNRTHSISSVSLFGSSASISGHRALVGAPRSDLSANGRYRGRVVYYNFSSAVIDSDGDGVTDFNDNCDDVQNPEQVNSDFDSYGDACDTDDDNDGVNDIVYAFPLDNSEWADSDGDGVGDRDQACNLLDNGSFEPGFSGWSTNTNPTVVGDAFQGVRALSLTNGWISTVVELGSENRLQLMVNSKSNEGSGWAGFGLDYLDASGVEIGEIVSTIRPSTSFQTATSNYYAPNGTVFVRLWFFASESRTIVLDKLDIHLNACVSQVNSSDSALVLITQYQRNRVGDTVNHTIAAYDPENLSASLSFTAFNIPPGIEFDTSTGVFSGTFSAEGDFSVNVIVTDGSKSRTSAYTWSVSSENVDAPKPIVLFSPGIQVHKVGEPVSLIVEKLVPPGTNLNSYSASLPRGLEIDNSTGEISGTPERITQGIARASVTVYGNAPSSSVVFPWIIVANDIADNQPPIMQGPGNRLLTVGRFISDYIEATDPEGARIESYAIDNLPPGLILNEESGRISGAPTEAGSFYIEVSAFDGVATGRLRVEWRVRLETPAQNSSPVIYFPGNQVSAIGEPVNLQLEAVDLDGLITDYSASSLPSGLSINRATGLITGTPQYTTIRNTTIRVSDGTTQTETNLAWRVVESGEPLDYYSCNFLLNPDFEREVFVDWYSNNTELTLDNFPANSGRRFASFTDGSISATVAAQPGKQFTFSGFYASTYAQAWSGYGIDYLDSNGEEIAEVVQPLPATENYSETTLTGTVPQGATSMRLWMFTPLARTLSIDDLNWRYDSCSEENPL